MEHTRIDVHQHVVAPFPTKALPSSRRRSLGRRYSAMVAQKCDELHGLPKDRNTFSDRAERRPLKQIRPTGEDTPRQRIDVEFVVPAATDTDEGLVVAAKSRKHQAFVQVWKRHSK